MIQQLVLQISECRLVPPTQLHSVHFIVVLELEYIAMNLEIPSMGSLEDALTVLVIK